MVSELIILFCGDGLIMTTSTTPAGGNVFADLGVEQDEADRFKMEDGLRIRQEKTGHIYANPPDVGCGVPAIQPELHSTKWMSSLNTASTILIRRIPAYCCFDPFSIM